MVEDYIPSQADKGNGTAGKNGGVVTWILANVYGGINVKVLAGPTSGYAVVSAALRPRNG
jgi:hypothetical protein